jgi:hypothetical protein
MLVMECKWKKSLFFSVNLKKKRKTQLEIPIKTQIKSGGKRKR